MTNRLAGKDATRRKMSMKNRITLGDTLIEAITKIGEGNVGAVSIMARIMAIGGEIDPIGSPFMMIAYLDEWGIYGEQIWILYKKCQENIIYFMALLRARQLGIITREEMFKIGRAHV